MIKLLIADDSALMRKLLEGIFIAEGDFEVRLARNGREALELVKSFDPHVVTLDVQMPQMDGLSCLRQIMIDSPRPVVMVSTLTEEGAEATLEAMDLGAVDFVAKPSGAISLEIDSLRPILLEKVRGAASAKLNPARGLRERVRHKFRGRQKASRPSAPASSRLWAGEAASQGLILIGTSTGGPGALDTVLPQLPAGLPWPILVAQHMPANFTGPLARRINKSCQLNVVEVDRPMPMEPGTVFIARGDADVLVSSRAKGIIAMPAPSHRGYLWHPSVDRMVETAMQHYPAERLVGVLMTGMGNDGARTMAQLHSQGGHTIAEAESTAVVWGMPGELVKAGGAERVVPLDEIAASIVEWVGVNADH